MAQELNGAFERLLEIGEGLEVRVKPLPDHDGNAACEEWLVKRPDRLSEKHMARALAVSPCEYAFGRIIGYEVPLRQSNEGKVGAVDLFARAGSILKPLELKIAHTSATSDEGLLRAMLEVYTYSQALQQALKMVENQKVVANDSRSLVSFLSQATILRPMVLLERRSRGGQELLGASEYPELHKLAARLACETETGLECYVYDYPHAYPEGYSYTPISTEGSRKWRIELKYPRDFVAERVLVV